MQAEDYKAVAKDVVGRGLKNKVVYNKAKT